MARSTQPTRDPTRDSDVALVVSTGKGTIMTNSRPGSSGSSSKSDIWALALAWARIARANEHELCRQAERFASAGDGHHAILDGAFRQADGVLPTAPAATARVRRGP